MSNPDLALAKPIVQPLARFRNIMDDGKTVVESTRPLPVTTVEEIKAYICTQSASSFHRTDGKRLGFVDGYFETNLLYDQQYLDGEIVDGNPYLRHATEEEVFAAHMRLDPRGTMEKNVREQLLNDPSIREEIEAKIRAELAAGSVMTEGKTPLVSQPAPTLSGIVNSASLGGIAATGTVMPALNVK